MIERTMGHRPGWHCIASLAALLAIAGAAFAGPYEDANTAYKSGDYQSALRYAQQAVQEQPNDPRGYVALGTVERRLGDKNAARDAWSSVLRLDPDLNSIQNKDGFLNAYKAVGGQPPAATAPTSGTPSYSGHGSEVIRALTEGNVYVAPKLKGEVDPAQLDAVASPTTKIVAVTSVSPYGSPTEAASELRKALNLGEGVVIVGTPRRIGASSGRLSPQQIDDALAQANLNQALATGGLTAALAKAAQAVSGEVVTDRREDTGRAGGLLFAGLAVIGGIIGVAAYRKGKTMGAAREPLEQLHKQVLDNLSYVDGYLDLLPRNDTDADRARALRQTAYEKYSTVSGLLKSPKSPEELVSAQPLMTQALQELEECRKLIDKATGGTGVAMALPELPDQATDADRAARFRSQVATANYKPVEQIGNAQEAARYQQEIESIPQDQRGVSFFSGRPLPSSELVPVTITVNGQKRNVLASRDEAAAIERGQTPPIRAFQQGNQYVPWYEYRSYDPYRDYYGGWGYGNNALGTLVDFYILSHLFGGGLFGGYGPWGWGGWGWGMPASPVIINNYPGYDGPVYGGYGDYGSQGGVATADPQIDNAGGFDFFGQQGIDDTSPDPGGGFDFGGSTDFGGGDFVAGGGDFGGGDFGGGGGDFGGGDFGS